MFCCLRSSDKWHQKLRLKFWWGIIKGLGRDEREYLSSNLELFSIWREINGQSFFTLLTGADLFVWHKDKWSMYQSPNDFSSKGVNPKDFVGHWYPEFALPWKSALAASNKSHVTAKLFNYNDATWNSRHRFDARTLLYVSASLRAKGKGKATTGISVPKSFVLMLLKGAPVLPCTASCLIFNVFF